MTSIKISFPFCLGWDKKKFMHWMNHLIIKTTVPLISMRTFLQIYERLSGRERERNRLQYFSLSHISINIHVLWNHLNSLWLIFVDCGLFTYLSGFNFMDASVFSLSRKNNSFKIYFCRRCIFRERAAHIPRKLSHPEF